MFRRTADVADHCNRLTWGNFLRGFTEEDADIIQVMEVSGLSHLAPGLMHFEGWPPGKHDDFVVPPDVDLGSALLSIDTSDGEAIDVDGLRCGVHGQVDHGICGTGHYVWKRSPLAYGTIAHQRDFTRLLKI